MDGSYKVLLAGLQPEGNGRCPGFLNRWGLHTRLQVVVGGSSRWLPLKVPGWPRLSLAVYLSSLGLGSHSWHCPSPRLAQERRRSGERTPAPRPQGHGSTRQGGTNSQAVLWLWGRPRTGPTHACMRAGEPASLASWVLAGGPALWRSGGRGLPPPLSPTLRLCGLVPLLQVCVWRRRLACV